MSIFVAMTYIWKIFIGLLSLYVEFYSFAQFILIKKKKKLSSICVPRSKVHFFKKK